MTIYEFIALDEKSQGNAVWDGVILGTRKYSSYQVMLYDLNGFYVEVYYNDVLGKIERLRPFKSVANIKPYLANIEINELKILL